MAETDALRRKSSLSPLARRDHDAARPLVRATARGALPSVRTLLQAGALVSAATTLGVGAVACGQRADADAANIAADESPRTRHGSLVGFLSGVASSASTGTSAAGSATLMPTSVPVPLGGAAPANLPVPIGSASAVITGASGTKVGLATPPPTLATATTGAVPAPQRVPGGPTIATTITPTAAPPPVGGKPKAVVPSSPGATSAAQAPCPQPNGPSGTI